MEKPVWLEKVVKKYQFTLVTIPGMVSYDWLMCLYTEYDWLW